MSFLDVYIGNADGYSFECTDDEYKIGHVPKRIGPFFPEGNVAFSKLKEMIETGKLEGRQVDWGAWAARVNKVQILSLLEELYPDEYQKEKEAFRRAFSISCPDEYKKLKRFVDALSDDKAYVLVASEL